MVLNSKTLTPNIKNSHPVIIHLFNVVKSLLLSEVEMACWFIYLERFSWEKVGYSFEDNLLITALAAKVIIAYIIYIILFTLFIYISYSSIADLFKFARCS